MKNYIKAAYIFSILPQHIKSRCLTLLDMHQRALLEKGLVHITALTPKQQIAILAESINYLERLQRYQRHLLDISIFISLIIFCAIVITSAIVGRGWYATQNTFMYILQNGGLHALLLPFVIVYAQKVMQKPFVVLIKPSHIMYDVSISFIAAIAIIIIFMVTIPHHAVVFSLTSLIALFFAITAVPVAEELFFRGILFLHGGSGYGYIPSWFFASFVFASIHLPQTPLEFGAYFVCSSILCAVAYKYSLCASILSHMLSNTILFML